MTQESAKLHSDINLTLNFFVLFLVFKVYIKKKSEKRDFYDKKEY